MEPSTTTGRPDIRLAIANLGGGGSERVCVTLANHWAVQGLRVEILLVRRVGVFLGHLDPRVSVIAAGVPRTRQSLWWFFRQLHRRPENPVIVFGFDLAVGLGALRRLGLVRAPLVYREGSCPKSNISPRSHWKYGAFVGAMPGLVAQSRNALSSLRALGVQSRVSAVIWNPLAPRPVPTMRALPPPLGGVRLLAVGRLSSEKGYMRLLDSVIRLRREWPEISLMIAGDGQQRGEIERRIAELGLGKSVQLVGFVAQPEALMKEADVYVLPSHYEGQPNALLEALQLGCRVVAAGGAGVGELLGELGLGDCWVDGADFAAGMERALRRAIALPEEVWTQARERLAAKTEIGAVADAYREIAENCRK